MANRVDTVVVGTSLGEESAAVVRAASEVAEATGAALHLVHAFGLALGDEGIAAERATSEFLRRERETLQLQLEDQAERLGVGGQRLAGSVLTAGAPHRVLVQAAHEAGADLLVVGASEAPGPLERVLGSTADRVVRKATCPVLVIRGELRLPVRKALLPVDLSPLSADAFRYALDLLALIGPGGSTPEAEALLVLNEPLERSLSLRYDAPQERLKEVAERSLERFIDAHGTAAVTITRRTRVGRVGEEILAELEASRPDLVGMGTHGRGGFERFLIGSVAGQVLRRAGCSVLVVPPEAALRSALGRERAGQQQHDKARAG